MMKALMMFSALLTAPVLFAQDEAKEEPSAPPPPRSERKMDRQRPMLNPEMIKFFDKDGDGKLSRKERQSMREEMRKSMANHADSARAMGSMNRGGRQLPPEMIKKFDKDGDGTLSQEERKAMRAEFQKMMQSDSGRKMMGERMNRGEGFGHRSGTEGRGHEMRNDMPPPPTPAEEEAGL